VSKAKPWQIVVVVAAVVAAGITIYRLVSSGDGPRLASSMQMVDVNTGDLFTVEIGSPGAQIPGRNPKTQEYTLLPVEKNPETQQLTVNARNLTTLPNIPGAHAAVDPKSGQVRSTPAR
jgi:hypothetical protein